MVILEDEEHAKKRGANILAKISGYYANSDGYDMVAPSGEGAARCMKGAMKDAGLEIDYINTHGTSTPVHTDQNQIGCTLNERSLAAKRGSPIQIMSPGIGICGRQFAVNASAESSNDGRHNPGHHKSIRSHEVGTHHTTQGEDSGADHRRDHHAGRPERTDVAFGFVVGWRIG